MSSILLYTTYTELSKKHTLYFLKIWAWKYLAKNSQDFVY